jgi:LPS export ABC transporter protein LptC
LKYLGIIIGVSMLCSCGEDIASTDISVKKEEVSVEVGKDVEILYSDSAIVRIKITAPVMYNYLDNEQRQTFPNGIKVEFFDANATSQSVLTAKNATRKLNERTVVIRDSIEWHSIKQENLYTEELIWDERNNTIFTKKFVKITRPGEKMFGYDFKSNQDFSKWELSTGSGWVKSDALNKELQ